MKDIGYVFRRLLDMNYKQMFQKVNSLHKKTGKSRLFLLRDMQKCAVNYGAGYMDYDLFEMYNLTPEQRDTYLTRGRNNALFKQYNDPAYRDLFDDKADFNERFDAYLLRDWVRMDADKDKDAVMAFIRKHEVFMAKPVDGTCGKGVEKIDTKRFSGAEAVYEYLSGIGAKLVLEELIVQHPAVSSIYPDSINTVRTVSIYKDGEVHIICTYFRIGNNGKHVDNFNSGGMVTPVDEKTGIVKCSAIDKQKNLYATHPSTGTEIKGFQFPDWDKAMDLIRAAALEIPQVAYVGWDLAFSEKGPCLVEGNNFPGHDLYQLPEHTPDRIGIMDKFRV